MRILLFCSCLVAMGGTSRTASAEVGRFFHRGNYSSSFQSSAQSVSTSSSSFWKDGVYYIVDSTRIVRNGEVRNIVETTAFGKDKKWYRHVIENGKTTHDWTIVKKGDPDVWADDDGIHVSPRILEPLDEPDQKKEPEKPVDPKQAKKKQRPSVPIIQNFRDYGGKLEILD